MVLSQAEADRLIEMIKQAIEEFYLFPGENGKLTFDVIGTRATDEFVINISRKGINSENCSYQGRVRKDNQILLRIDIGATLRHTNPPELGEQTIVGDHIHIYREGYDMDYAVPFDINSKSLLNTCYTFFEKFGIINPPTIHEQTALGPMTHL